MDGVLKENLDIINSFDINSEYKTVLQRYYTPMYCLTIEDKQIEPQCILFHSNRICLVTIAPSHPIIKDKKTIKTIDFVTAGNVNRLENIVSGKSKRGGQKLTEKSVLCRVECDDGCRYDIFSCIKGKLIEINKNLLENPNLLVTDYNTLGHVAIVLADLSKISNTKENLLTEDDYDKLTVA